MNGFVSGAAEGTHAPRGGFGAVAAAALTCLACLMVTTFLVRMSSARLEADAASELSQRADSLELDLSDTLTRVERGLKGMRAAFITAGRMEPEDLRKYVTMRELRKEFAGILGFGIAVPVARGDLAAFVEAQRQGGRPGFSVRTHGTRDLLVVRTVEPVEDNRAAIGIDMISEGEVRGAVEEAIASGRPTITPPFHLLQDQEHRLGWLMLMPVYSGQPRDAAERRQQFIAMAYAPMVAQEVIGAAVRMRPLRASVVLRDGASGGGAVLFQSRALSPADLAAPRLARPVRIDGRDLTLEIAREPGAPGSAEGWVPPSIAAAGALLSALLAWIVWLLISGRDRAMALARAMTADLDRMARIVERTRSAAFSADPAGRLTWVNRGFEELTGLAQDALAGKCLADVFAAPGDGRGERAHRLRGEFLGAPGNRFELEHTRPDGTRFWADVEVQALRDGEGEVAGYVGVAFDVTERKQMEMQLRESQHLIHMIADNIPARISYWDRDLRCGFANRRFCEVFGTNQADLLGRQLSPAVIGNTEAERTIACVREALQGLPQQYERSNVEPNGREGTWQVHMIPDIDEEDGSVQGVIVLANDVTELRIARDMALNTSHAKSRFLSSMSHEIRTPMNAVIGMLRLLQGTGLDARQLDYADKARSAATSLLGLLNDILDFSKIEAGRMELDCRPFRVDDMLRDVAIILSANVAGKDLELVYDVDPRLPQWLVGDDMRLRQILVNLGGNAVKFTASGQVVVELKLLGREAGGVRVQLAVEDSGIGISAEEQARLFGDYAQASGATARQFGGTGLGLGICRKLTQLMGGELALESRPGVGTRFSIQITLPEAPVPDTGANDVAIDRVLIVDDNLCSRSALAAMAQAQGWRADTAATGEEALRLIACCPPHAKGYDAIFMDWCMPGMDGWEAAQRIRRMEGRPRAPLLMMVTAHGREVLTDRPAEEQALLDGFLEKPVTGSMLREAVARALAGPVGAAPAAVPTRPLRGIRLLVVEDNEINQEIARELLAEQGAEVEIAPDGEEAVRRLSQPHEFSVVLMDIQMPVMDGLTAARILRADPRNAGLPILAMTANAMDSDRADCEAAGMNGHVTKPFNVDELVRIVLSHVPHAAKDAAGDAPVMDREGALDRLGRDGALLDRLLPAFRKNLHQAATDLPEWMHQRRADDAARCAHTIKGLAATLGALRLCEAATTAERRLLDGDAAEADAAVGRMLSAIGQTLEALE